jgi:two-component system, LytTR family, sensor kinase
LTRRASNRIDDPFFVKTGFRQKAIFLIKKLIKYIYTINEWRQAMRFKKSTYYLLFFIAYIGALVIEKPAFTGNSVMDCFTYMLTIIAHFSIFTLMIIANNAFVIPNLLIKKRFTYYVSGLFILISLYTFFMSRYNQFIHGVLFHDNSAVTASGFWDNFVYGLCCSVIASMLYITQKWSEQQDQVKNIQITQLQTELKYLRSQINPHFLFNGLNTVYGYIDMNNSVARDMMVQFSDLLRYNLYEADVEMIELEKEIKYLQDYVALQKARSNDNMEVTLKVNYENGSVKIAPLIFMAFVENAFKYASRGDQSINTIGIGLNEKAGRIDFTCDNSYDEAETEAGGIGLNNAARRLEILYKDRYQLDIKKEATIFHVHLTITV